LTHFGGSGRPVGVEDGHDLRQAGEGTWLCGPIYLKFSDLGVRLEMKFSGDWIVLSPCLLPLSKTSHFDPVLFIVLFSLQNLLKVI
jgi:hypothetical protein